MIIYTFRNASRGDPDALLAVSAKRVGTQEHRLKAPNFTPVMLMTDASDRVTRLH
jgi:hypothetical protein